MNKEERLYGHIATLPEKGVRLRHIFLYEYCWMRKLIKYILVDLEFHGNNLQWDIYFFFIHFGRKPWKIQGKRIFHEPCFKENRCLRESGDGRGKPYEFFNHIEWSIEIVLWGRELFWTYLIYLCIAVWGGKMEIFQTWYTVIMWGKAGCYKTWTTCYSCDKSNCWVTMLESYNVAVGVLIECLKLPPLIS